MGTLLSVTLILIACGERRGATVGDNDDIVVAAEPSLWKQVQGRTNALLQPRLFGIPNSRAFQVTYQDPAEEEWSGASHNRQVLLIGEPEDAWVVDALARARDTPSEIPPAPALFELQDVWAEDQQVMVLLVPPTDPRRTVLDKLDELSANYELRYREDVVVRMFADGTGQALWDTIMGESGFNVLVPRDYERSKEGDVYLFQKTVTDSLEAVRHVTVTWRTPIPPDMQGDGLLRFRRQLATAHFGSPQTVSLRNVLASQTTHQGKHHVSTAGDVDQRTTVARRTLPWTLHPARRDLPEPRPHVPVGRVALRPGTGSPRVHGRARIYSEFVQVRIGPPIHSEPVTPRTVNSPVSS